MQLFSEKKEQFLQVTRRVNPTSSPVQMASVLQTHGCVITTMTVVITQTRASAVSSLLMVY